MDTDRQIKELQERIDLLSKDINSFQQELGLLQNKLDSLRTGQQQIEPNEIIHKRTTSPEDSLPGFNQAGLENYIGLRFMHIVGIIEIVAGILVLIRPRVGGYVVMAWLTLIALTLIFGGPFVKPGMAAADWAVATLSELDVRR